MARNILKNKATANNNSIELRVTALENGQSEIMAMLKSQNEVLAGIQAQLQAKPAPKPTPKKSSKKKAAEQTVVVEEVEEPKTRAEAIEDWKSKKYTDAQRAAFGEAAKEVREMLLNETVTLNGKVYNLFGRYWRKRFKEEMKKKGFNVK